MKNNPVANFGPVGPPNSALPKKDKRPLSKSVAMQIILRAVKRPTLKISEPAST